ncbi:MAG: DNA polymerase Y family protein [Gammaproteobacteria bacterium]|nr:DNA polymerase Y family protein [Gammaproteobacteria bacterium]
MRAARRTPHRSRPAARPLWLSLYLPGLPLEALGQGGRIPPPAAVVEARGVRAWLVACDQEALAHGLRTGMALDTACALAPTLRILWRDAQAERSALEGLALWAGQFTSFIHPVPPRGLLLEVGASLTLLGGLERLRGRVRGESRTLGYNPCLAVAPTPLGAWLLARSGREACVTALSALPGCLARVPLSALDLEAETLAALTGMGLRTFGDCCRLPRADLARRLGPELVRTLDRALGKRADPRRPWVAPPRFERRLFLPAAVTQVEALLFAAHRLLLELTGFLVARESGVQALTLELHRRGKSAIPITFERVAPTRDAQHLLTLLRERLMRLELAAASEGVEALCLRAENLQPLAPRNLDLFADASRVDNVDTAWIERLQARLGSPAVHGLMTVPDHRPEQAWRACPPGESAPPVVPPAVRPLWLLPRPRPLETVNGTPWLGGALRLHARPERIESGWWDDGAIARDYFVAQNPEGATFWIYRTRRGDPRWFLHGVFG